MKKKAFSHSFLVVIAICYLTLGCFYSLALAEPTKVDAYTKTRIHKSYGKLPLYFIENKGQVDKQVRFYEKSSRHTTYFTRKGVYFSLIKAGKYEVESLKLNFERANAKPQILPMDKQKHQVNYFIGNDKSKWKNGISTYKTVVYKEVYPGIDVKFYGNNRQLEYDLVLAPGADPSQIKLSYEGIKNLKLDKKGNMEIILAQGSLIQKAPYVYQIIDGKRVMIDGSLKLYNNVGEGFIPSQKGGSEQDAPLHEAQTFAYGFTLAAYDKSKPLIIDPILAYSTYLGGSSIDVGFNLAIDTAGNAYVIGYTSSADFLLTTPLQKNKSGGQDIFVSKIDATGRRLVYSTYLGGSDTDSGYDIALDASGNAYITGRTASADFPMVNPLQKSYAGGSYDTFVSKIDRNGRTLVYSTYLGGNSADSGRGIAVDADSNVYIIGYTQSTDFPLANALQGSLKGAEDAFVSKINSAGSALTYSTYLGGNNRDEALDIAVDTSGNAYIAGWTTSTDFPLANTLQGSLKGAEDAFVSKINSAGSALTYSTYLGGNNSDGALGIALDVSGNAYITGRTASTDFPLVNPLQKSYAGNTDAFISKINSAGSALTYSTYLGGNNSDGALGIALDVFGNAYITGRTASIDFPLVNPLQKNYAGGSYDTFVSKINSVGSALAYSTYLGGHSADTGCGIALNTASSAYIIGNTQSTDFPTLNPLQPIYSGGSYDAFITRISEKSVIVEEAEEVKAGKEEDEEDDEGEEQINVCQLYTQDKEANWEIFFLSGDTIIIKVIITIEGDRDAVYNMQLSYFFTDRAGNNTLLSEKLLRNPAPGKYNFSLRTIIPKGAVPGYGSIYGVAVLTTGNKTLDKNTCAATIKIK